MMNVLMVAGFLGSGKTSLILSLARPLQERCAGPVAIIENEAGRIPVDGRILQETGLELREIFSGCICCSLQQDLRLTLQQLHETVGPELVIIEPSGIAAPGVVRDALDGVASLASVRAITVVDATRLGKAFALSSPFVAGGIAAADVVLLNKCDRIAPEDRARFAAQLKAHAPDVPSVCGTATSLQTAQALLDALETVRPGRRGLDVAALTRFDTPVVCARSLRVPAQTDAALAQGAASLLERVSQALVRADCSLLGHAKLAMGEGVAMLCASLTELGGNACVTGRVEWINGAADGGLNVIAYGVPSPTVEAIVDAALTANGWGRRHEA